MTVCEGICSKDWQKQMLNKNSKKYNYQKTFFNVTIHHKVLDEKLHFGNCL